MGAFVLDADIRLGNVIGLQQIKAQIASAVQGGAGGGVGGQSASVIGAGAIAAQNAAKANDSLAKSSKKAETQIRATSSATTRGTKAAKTFGDSVFLAGKRYAGFIAATAVPFAALGILRSGIQSIIEFDTAVTKFRQILGASKQEVAGFKQEFIDLSVATGTSASDIADIGKVLAQAGFRGEQLSEAIFQLSKVPLAPSFDTITGAVEGTIAALNQFNTEGLTTEDVLDKLTAVSNNFAASSEDIATGLARGGSAFEAIGGNLDEFVAAFATVRQVTRESASSVGTFFKTISSRLADPKITDFLSSKGINLFSATGDFVGPLEAFRRIGDALEKITNIQEKIDITTKLGGRRQISRLLALVNNVETFNNALKVSQASGGAFAETTEEGLTSLRAQLNITFAELNKLFQTLAEPIFIPLIQGFTGAASASVAFLEAISPILPVFGQMIAAVAGIKLLTFTIGSLASAAKVLAGVRLAAFGGALGALGAGGGAGAAARVQSRLAGGVGGAGAATTSAAISGVATGIVATGKKLITSQLGQIAIAGVASVALGFFADKASEAGNASAEFAFTVAKNLALLVAGISLISGATPGALIGKVFTGLTGALIGVGTVLATSVIVGSRRAKEAIDSTLASAIDKIKSIDFEFENEAEFRSAVGDFGKSIVGRINDAASQFRDVDTGEQSFGQFAIAASKGLTDLLSGQRGLTDNLITDSQVNQLIDDIIGETPGQLNAIFEGAVDIFGTEFEKGLIDTLTQAFGGTAEAAEAAQKVVQRLIEQQGQSGINTALGGSTQRRKEAAEKAIVKELERTVGGLRKIEVPSALSIELKALNDAVARTVIGIDSSSQSFTTLAGAIGEIGGTDLSLKLTDLSLDDIIGDEKALRDLLGTEFSNAAQAANEVQTLRDSIDDLVNSLLGSEAAFFQGDIKEALKSPTVQPSTIVDEIIKSIADFKGLEGDDRTRFEGVGKRIARSVLGGITPDDDTISEAIDFAVGPQRLVAEEKTRDAIEKLFGAIGQSANSTIERQAAELQRIAERTSPESRFEGARDIGQALQDSISIHIEQLGFGDFENGIVDMGLAMADSQQFFDQAVGLQKQLAEAYQKSSDSAGLTASELLEAEQGLTKLRLSTNELKTLLNIVVANLEAEKQSLDPSADPGRIREIDEAIDRLTQQLNEARLRVTDVATTPKAPENIFNKAVGSFQTHVGNFDKAITKFSNIFTRPLTGKDVDIDRLPRQTISAPGAVGFRSDALGRISSAALGNQADPSEFNKAAFGIESFSPLIEAFRKELVLLNEGAASARNFGFDVKSAGELIKQAAQNVADQQISRLQGQGGPIPNEANIAKNIIDLLTGGLNRPGGIPAQFADIDPKTRSGIEAGQGLREENAIAIAESARKLEDAGGKIAVSAAELTSASLEFFNRVPGGVGSDLLFDPATLAEFNLGEPGQNVPVSIDQSNAIGESLQIGSETLKTGSELLQLSAQSLVDGSQQLVTSAQELSAIVDLTRQTQTEIPADTSQGGKNVGGAGSQENTAALAEVQGSLNELSAIIGQRVEQASEPQAVEIEDIEIPGLEGSSEATSQNSEALSSATVEMGNLASELSATQAALEEGINLDLQATQNINIDVRGLEGAVQELQPQFEAVAKRVAVAVMKQALSELAARTSDSLQSSEINNIAEGFA